MTRQQVLTLALACLCIAALGVSATTLESSVTTDPDDAIDPNYDLLPIGQSDAAEILDDIEGGESGDDTADDSTDDSADTEADAPPDDSDEDEREEDAGLTDGIAEEGPGEQSLLDRLLALLLALLRVLVPVLAVVAAVGVAYRYRERLLAFLAALIDSDEADREPTGTTDEPSWPTTEPSNPIESAWVTLVQRSNVQRPETTTPRECATRAIERGMDPGDVESIVAAFEAMRYGAKPVTEEQERLAREAMFRLEPVTDGDGGE